MQVINLARFVMDPFPTPWQSPATVPFSRQIYASWVLAAALSYGGVPLLEMWRRPLPKFLHWHPW